METLIPGTLTKPGSLQCCPSSVGACCMQDELLVIVLSPLLLVMAAQPARGSVNKDCATLPLARRLDLLHVATMEAISRTWDVVHERPPQHEPREIYDRLLSGAPVSIHLPLHHLAARLTCLVIATQVPAECFSSAIPQTYRAMICVAHSRCSGCARCLTRCLIHLVISDSTCIANMM
jgi:hypothetical protein